LLERAAIVLALTLAIGALWGGLAYCWIIRRKDTMTTKRGAAGWSIVSGLQLGAFSFFFSAGMISAEAARDTALGLVWLICGLTLSVVTFRFIGQLLTPRIMRWLEA
jgi:hypothetical protein